MVESNGNQKREKDQRANFYEYLKWLHDHYEPYHARKEQVAWAAATVYMTGIIAIISIIIKNPDSIKLEDCLLKVAISMLLLITLGLMHGFMKAQFDNREVAAPIVAVVGDLMAKLVNPDFEISTTDLKTKEYKCPAIEYPYRFPNIIKEALDDKKKSSEQSKLKKLKKWLRKTVISNKCPIFLITGLWTLVAVFAIWYLP